MFKQAFIAGICLGILYLGCVDNNVIGPGNDLQTDIDRAAFDAWVIHGSHGEVLSEGKEILEIGLERRPLEWGHVRGAYIDPMMEEMMNTAGEGEIVEVILSVRTNHRMSLLPRFDRNLSMEHPFNLEVLESRRKIVSMDDRKRSLERSGVKASVEYFGGEVKGEHAVGNAIVCEITLGALRKILVRHPELAAVSPARTEVAVWGKGDTYSDVPLSVGRAAQNSDQYVNAGYDGYGYRVGLLDTGVYASHSVFNSPDRIAIWKDCAWTVYSSCNKFYMYPWSAFYDAGDAEYDGGHGTGIANIIKGNANMGSSYQGVAPQAWLDSTNVYLGDHHNSLSETAVMRAFDRLSPYDDVIVANVTVDQSEAGTVSLAADDLYDQGVIMIAPVGNSPMTYSYSPANAHKVMGIGAYYADTGGDYVAATGVYTDQRIKPDLTGPTGVMAATNTGPYNVGYTNGTRSAAGFVGGAAILLRDYYDSRGWSSDPGAIYAALITFGDEGGSDIGYPDGAGNLELGEINNSVWLSGVRYVEHGTESNINFNIGSNSCDLRAGIWWAEDFDKTHRVIWLHLNDTVSDIAESTHYYSVFQKVLYPGNLSAGPWELSIYSSVSNPSGAMKVHYLIHYRTNCQ